MNSSVDVWTDPELDELLRQDAPLVALADALVAGRHTRASAIDHRRHRATVVAGALIVGVAALALAVALSQSLRTLIGLSPPVRFSSPQVEATLTSHVPTSARPGTQVRISWKLWSRNQGHNVPFVAAAIVARIVDPARTIVSTAPAHGEHGRYTAIVEVPRGGIGRVEVGIHAYRFGPNGTHPTIVLFRITNQP